MRTITRFMPLIAIAVLLIQGGLVIALALRDTGNRQAGNLAYALDAYVHGATAEEWTARHWQWTLGFPVSSNPGYDATGGACGAGQSGPVFFIPRNMPPCTVPEGVAVLIPVAGVECSTRDSFPYSGASEEELRDCAAREADRYTNISVTVDGVAIPDVELHRTSTPLFSVVLPEGNVLAAPAGAAWVVADGYNVMLRPLPPGEHVIIVHTELADGTVLPDERLVLTVIEPSWEPVPATPAIATPGPTPVDRR